MRILRNKYWRDRLMGMTKEEAKAFLTDISYDLGTMGIEYLTVKDGEKMRDAIETLEQEPTTKNDLAVDAIPRETIFDFKVKLDNWLFSNYEDVCGQRMIDIDYLEGAIWEKFSELGIIRYDDDGNCIDEGNK